jgi:TonB family protein
MVRASTALDRVLASEKIGAGIVTASHLDDAGAKPAVLVAPAPLPHFPDELRAQWDESEVAVRFRVDERGRVDVASMKVLKSDHDRFVAAVREVLPRFRFEPARSAAPESKPISDWVDYRVKFAAVK